MYHFIIDIGGEILQFVMKCVSDVFHAVELVFKKIGVFFEDIAKWVGFVFEWGDILRTHNMLKNIIKRYLEHSVEQVNTYKDAFDGAIQGAEDQIKHWASLENTKGSLKDISRHSPSPTDTDSHWGTHHLRHNASASSTSTDISPSSNSDLKRMLNDLGELIKNEEGTFERAYDSIKDQIIGQIDSLSVGQIIKRLLSVVATFALDTMKNVVDALIDIFAILVGGVIHILDAQIEIPVISWMYRKITGHQLTALDALCLVVAIPSTIIFKIAEHRVLFPDNSFTNKLIRASNWTELQSLFRNADDVSCAANVLAETTANTDVIEGILHLVAFKSAQAFIALSILKKASLGKHRSISIFHGICFFTTTAPSIGASLLSSHENQDIRGDPV